MYWYYKYPLIAVLLLLGVGICYTIWRSLPATLTEKVTGTLTEPFAKAPGEGDPGAACPPEAEPQPVAPFPGGAAPGADGTEEGPAAADPQPVPSQEPDPIPTAVVPPPPPPPPEPGAAALDLHEAARLLDTGESQFAKANYLAARELGWKAMALPGVVEFDRIWGAAADLVNRVNALFMASDTANPERKAYTVQSGDSLSRIATSLNVTVGALQRLNDLDPTNPVIYPGSVLYVLDTRWSIRVVKSKYVLLLRHGERLYRVYRVGIGRENRTPVGVFDISSKVIHPAWTPPGKSYPYGDPENPLGSHWLGLTPVDDTDPSLRGYGIHGTWEPDTIGTAASQGCVRLLNDDIAELFDFIPEPGRGPSVRVTIED
ncbi:MAG: L,D-transpeptidase family protein [Lentisphaeria bacterium]|nr:L,D-transpeptidase family protein [Lentisphaeria bacterium]